MAISDGYPHNIERAWARGLGERFEKGTAIREMYFIIFPFHIAADIFFSPKTTKHCSASQLQIYMDIWPSIFRPYASGTLCINRKEDITISAFTNWFAGLHKKNAICGIVIFFYLQNQEILALLLRIFVWAYLSHIKMIWH